MHSYLRSVGFSDVNRKDLEKILEEVVCHYDEKHTAVNESQNTFAEFIRYYTPGCGLAVCGEYEEDGTFRRDYYFPIFKGNGVTTQEKTVVERHADKEAFAGACDDYRVGITLIFYLQNPARYMREGKRENMVHCPLTLVGLAEEGKILFPVEKDKELVRIQKESDRNRNDLMEAARNGDEEAIESLTMEDMDTYSMLSKRIVTEDIMSIVDTYFMPYGIECDRYGIMGEIRSFSRRRNEKTGEELCCMTVESRDIVLDVVINQKDLLGEPAVGRRFKGNIWLQGELHY